MIEVGLLAAIGAILHGIGAWLDSKEPFDPRLFLRTLITAVVAGGLFTTGYAIAGVSPEVRDLIIAFQAGITGNALRDYVRGASK